VTTFDAILPAGGNLDATLAERVGTPNKALIPFEGRTILARTLDALEGSGRVGRTILVGTPEVQAHPDAKRASRFLPAGTSGPDTIFRGLKSLLEEPSPPAKVLIVTTDMPFLSPELVIQFLDLCPADKDICVPLVTKSQFLGRFPGADATFIPLRDDSWTAGCAYVMDVAAFQRALPHLERLFQNRKSKVGMIRMLGFGFLWKFVTKTLTVPDVERKIQSMLHCSGSAILNAPAELAYDIDFLDDYEYALEHLKTHGRRN